MHTTSLILSLSISPVPLPPSSSHHHPPATGRTAAWLTQTHAAITAQAQLKKKRKKELLHRRQQPAMSDHASRKEVVRRVEAKLKIAREKGEFGKEDDTEEKILSIARNTCGEVLE